MKIGLISDIHGNAAALVAVMAFFQERGVEEMVCAGDLVGYNVEAKAVV